MPYITFAAAVTAIIKAVISFAISTAISFAISALTKGPRKRGVDTGPLASQLSAGGPKRVVFGHTAVRAASLIANKKISGVHHWAAAICDVPITEFISVYIRGQKVTLDGQGWVTSAPWGDGGAQTIKLTYYDGTQANLSALVALDLVETGSIGIDTAIVHAEITVPQQDKWIQLFQGVVPDMIFEVKGAKVYDPTDLAQDRYNPATWAFAEEAILIQAFHQISPLGRNRSVDEIDWDNVAAIVPRHRQPLTSKRGDTHPRFAARGVWYAKSETHADVEARIGRAHAGGLIDMAVEENATGGGALQRFFSSDPDGPAVVSIVENDLGPGEFSGPEDAAQIDEMPNGVRVTFPNRSWAWETYTLLISFAAVTEKEVPLDVEFIDTVDSHLQAATLGLIAYNRIRYGQTWAGTFAPRFLPLQADDIVSAAIAPAGLAGTERLRVIRSGVDGDDYAGLHLTRDEASWHDDAGALEPTEIDLVSDTSPVGEPEALPAPTVVASSGGTALVDVDGVIIPGLLITITGAVGIYSTANIVASYGAGEDGVEFSRTRSFDGSGAIKELFSPLATGQLVNWEVRVFSANRSSVSATGSHTVSGDQTAPAAPSNLTASGGAGIISGMADAPSDSDTDALIFAYVAESAPAPDMSTATTRKVVSAVSNEADIPVSWSGVGVANWDVYAATLDRAGNISALAGPITVTVT